MSDTSAITVVSFDDVQQAMSDFGVVLTTDKDNPIGSANLNGYHVSFALINNSAVIVRADKPTEEKVADGNPSLFLACNHFNAYVHSTKAAALNRTDTIIIRTECEFLTAAGLSQDQLRASLQRSVDNVLAAQESIARFAQSLGGDDTSLSD